MEYIDEELSFSDTLGVVYENGRTLIRGYATVFNKESPVVFGMADMIAAGAFDGVLDDDIFAVYAHNMDNILGRNTAGTLRLEQDRKGLLMEIDPPDTTVARDLMESIRRGDVTGGSMHISFSRNKELFETKNKGKNNEYVLRTVQQVNRLYEVTVTPIPRIKEAQVGLIRARYDAQLQDERPIATLTDRERRLKLAELA